MQDLGAKIPVKCVGDDVPNENGGIGGPSSPIIEKNCDELFFVQTLVKISVVFFMINFISILKKKKNCVRNFPKNIAFRSPYFFLEKN